MAHMHVLSSRQHVLRSEARNPPSPRLHCLHPVGWQANLLICQTLLKVHSHSVMAICTMLCAAWKERKEMFLFNDALNTFYLRLYMASDIWLRTIVIVRKEIRCRHIGYSLRLTVRVLLYAPSHRQDSTTVWKA